jgi:DNA gyrase subunit A
LQQRGGRGVIGVKTRESDAILFLLVADTHDDLLFFTNLGKVFRLKCHEVPMDISRTAKGIPLVNLISLGQDERVTALLKVEDFTPGRFILLAARSGEIKKTSLEDFAQVRSNGLIAMNLESGDELVSVRLADSGDEIILVSNAGQAIKFNVDILRTASRTSGGVRGIRLSSGARLIDMEVASPGAYLMVITTNGFGKLTPVSDYPSQHRGGSGVRAHKITAKTGELVAARVVHFNQEVMVISSEGVIIRMPVSNITVQGRDSQGVHIMRADDGDRVASIARLDQVKSKKPSKSSKADTALPQQ